MKNPFSKLKFETRKGYTLLFAVIVSVLVLSIAAFILSISRKQFILSSASRDSVYAFYAADSGIECATEHRGDQNSLLSTTSIYKAATGGPAVTVNCGNVTWTSVPTTNPAPTLGHATTTWQMSIPNGGKVCAIVSAWYTTDPSGIGPVNYYIDSRGYNIGWNTNTNTCSDYGPRRVERALRYSVNF